MNTNNQSMMVEGANPDMLWLQHIDYLATQSKIMKKEYSRRKRANKPFTWNDLDVMNKKIHHDLDVVMSGVENVQENKQNTNMNKKLIRLTENDLHRIVKESVNKILREAVDGNLYGLRKMQGEELYDDIDNSLSQLGDDVYVSRFYSDENQITIAANRTVGRNGKREIIEMMKNYGYDYYTSGANDQYIMMTFKPF